MSSELLELESDANDSSVHLSMSASGDAYLTTGGENEDFYYLPSTLSGLNRARSIIQALETWIEHTEKNM